MLAPTAIVIVDVPPPGAAIVLGLKLTVVPVGAPEADNPTALLKPPPIVVVMVDVPCVPCTTFSAAGFAFTVRLGCCEPVTVSVTVAVCCIPPPAPVTVIGYVPGVVLAPTTIVIAEVPAPGAGIVLGLKLTVVPVGAPVADRTIALLKPPLTVVVIVELP